MAKRLYTESDVRALRPGSELVLGSAAMATPAALDAAYLAGVRVRYADASDGASSAAPQAGPCLATLRRMVRQEGTYVVEVKGGIAQVFRLGAAGPEKVGDIETAEG